MARSAKRPEKTPRRGDTAQAAAVALGGFVSRNPLLVGGSTAFLVALFYVSANALWYQPHAHLGALFATREFAGDATRMPMPDDTETTINIERPEPAPPRPKADPVIEQVQGILKDLDLYGGAVDGLPGPNTRKAIEGYRKMVGLPAGGDIDDTLLEQLGAKPITSAIKPQPAPRGVPTDVAAKPVTGPDQRVTKIQAGLKAFGNDAIEIDGVAGARTKSAIREFQALFGLPESGEADEAVYAKMREIGLIN